MGIFSKTNQQFCLEYDSFAVTNYCFKPVAPVNLLTAIFLSSSLLLFGYFAPQMQNSDLVFTGCYELVENSTEKESSDSDEDITNTLIEDYTPPLPEKSHSNEPIVPIILAAHPPLEGNIKPIPTPPPRQ